MKVLFRAPKPVRLASSDRMEKCAVAACTLEATARKAGNVHPDAPFDDLSHDDFLTAARVVAPILAGTRDRGVGPTVLECVRAVRGEGLGNVNLGIVLLLAPLAAVPAGQPIREGIRPILDGLTREDSAAVFEAIRLASPGGLGRSDAEDVSGEPTLPLRDVMRLSKDRDTIAGEYASGFTLTLDFGVPRLGTTEGFADGWEEAVVRLHLELMARRPDTLIARKCGPAVAEESASRAYAVLSAGWPTTLRGRRLFGDLDRWLREDGHRRNPGTSADLVAACLFAAFREGLLPIPPALP